MRGLVIYKGRYGATEQYAKWLGAALKLELWPAGSVNKDSLIGYDYFLIGSSVYIGKLEIKKWLVKNLPYLKAKKIFFFQVAGSPAQEIEKRQAYNDSGIPKEIISNCEFYFLPGRMVMQKLSWKDRFMLKMGARLTKNLTEKKAMLTDYDDVVKENLNGLITAVEKYTGVLKPQLQ